MAARRKKNGSNSSYAYLGFEATLWAAADKLRNNMDAAEYKHIVLGLIFLKYISDAFSERYEQLQLWTADPGSEYFVAEERQRYELLEDRDEYAMSNVFWVPREARWPYLQSKARQPEIGKLIDDAMVAVERENTTLKGVLPKDYARPALDKRVLGELIDLIGTIGLGDRENRSKDILGRVYEYFLSMFASAEGKRGGEFYTPRCVVQLLVVMLAPYRGRIYDPCCGSGGMFVQSEKFVEAHGGSIGDISVFGQESNPTTWRLAKMNLAIRGIDSNFGAEHADSFHRDLHPDLKADYVLANPPFNDSDWGGERLRDDVRWRYGAPPTGNANFAWVQHFIHHLAPTGLAGFVLANGSMSSQQSGEGQIRESIVEADLVDCMVALPGQLFYSTQIPVCLWFLARDKRNGRFRDRRRQTLFIDARKLGRLVDRTHRELTDEEIARIAATYHAWRGDAGEGVGSRTVGAGARGAGARGAETVGAGAWSAATVGAGARGAETAPQQPNAAAGATGVGAGFPRPDPRSPSPRAGAGIAGAGARGAETAPLQRNAAAGVAGVGAGFPRPALAQPDPVAYEDVPGFCGAATTEEIAGHRYILTPGRYVGAEAAEDDGEPFEEKMARLTKLLGQQFAESTRLEEEIRRNLREAGYGL